MRVNIARLFFMVVFVFAVTLPTVASAANASCIRRGPHVTEVALILAFVATALALVFRRTRIT